LAKVRVAALCLGTIESMPRSYRTYASKLSMAVPRKYRTNASKQSSLYASRVSELCLKAIEPMPRNYQWLCLGSIEPMPRRSRSYASKVPVPRNYRTNALKQASLCLEIFNGYASKLSRLVPRNYRDSCLESVEAMPREC
jgi:hypothetical protein